MAGILFIISAPSGSGKSTLVNALHPLAADLEFSISYTTRAPRGAEQDGNEYHFTTRDHFLEMVSRGEFLEWAEVFGNYYGTARHTLEDAEARGKDLLLDIDVQGADQVRHAMPDAVSIFVLPPNPEILEARLRSRSLREGSLAEETILRRLDNAKSEIDNYRYYNYVIINDVLKDAVEQLTAIVTAERVRRHPEYAREESQRAIDLAAGCLETNARERLHPVLKSFGLVSEAAKNEAAHV